MNHNHYGNLRFTEDYHFFMFYSDGPKGRLKKMVVYSPFKNLPDCYNLGFGTLKLNREGREYLDGRETSDNGDRNKILATIAITAYAFIDRYPDKTIYLTGSDNVRTRLYQMAINYAYDELSEKFIIYGDTGFGPDNFDLEPFEKGINYTGFWLKKDRS